MTLLLYRFLSLSLSLALRCGVDSAFSSWQTDRRRLEYTREIKEEQCYVPLDFDMEVDEYGAFKRKAMRVCKGAQASPMLSDYEACDSRE